MIQTEQQCLKAQKDVFTVTDRREKDDTSSWLIRTKWPETFSGRNRILIGNTRFLKPDHDGRIHKVVQNQGSESSNIELCI